MLAPAPTERQLRVPPLAESGGASDRDLPSQGSDPPSRRRFLKVAIGASVAGVGGATAYGALAHVGADVPAGARIRRWLGACGEDPGLPVAAPGPLESGVLADRWLHARTEWYVSYPPGSAVGDRLPVVLVLHGSEGTAEHAFEVNHGLDRIQASMVPDHPPFALAAVDSHDTFWHPRADGRDPLALITDGFVPVLTELGLIVNSIPIHGWGSGGYGAFLARDRLESDGIHVPAIASLSPAIFPTWDFVSGAYDSAEDLERWRIDAFVDGIDPLTLLVDCGRDDPFAEPVAAFRQRFADANTGVAPVGSNLDGCRDMAFWHRRHPDHLKFVVAAA